MAVVINEDIAINGIKDIVLTIGIISAIVFRMEAKTQELITYFLFRGKTCFCNKRLYQNSTDIFIPVLCEAYHAIWTSIKVFVMCFNTFEERGEVVVGITKIVQLNNLRTIGR